MLVFVAFVRNIRIQYINITKYNIHCIVSPCMLRPFSGYLFNRTLVKLIININFTVTVVSLIRILIFESYIRIHI
jgi:hypothetical protein